MIHFIRYNKTQVHKIAFVVGEFTIVIVKLLIMFKEKFSSQVS